MPSIFIFETDTEAEEEEEEEGLDRSRVDSRGILNDEETGEGEEAVGGVGGVGGVMGVDGEEGREGVIVEEAEDNDDVLRDVRGGGGQEYEGDGGEGIGGSDAETVSAF